MLLTFFSCYMSKSYCVAQSIQHDQYSMEYVIIYIAAWYYNICTFGWITYCQEINERYLWVTSIDVLLHFYLRLGFCLNWFCKRLPVVSLSLKELTLKLTFLLLLLSGQRCQTVSIFLVEKMDLSDTSCIFTMTDKVKHTQKGYHIAPVEYLAYPENERLCVIKYLKEYVQRTKEIQNTAL